MTALDHDPHRPAPQHRRRPHGAGRPPGVPARHRRQQAQLARQPPGVRAALPRGRLGRARLWRERRLRRAARFRRLHARPRARARLLRRRARRTSSASPWAGASPWTSRRAIRIACSRLTLCDTHPGFAHFSEEKKREFLRLRREPLVKGGTPKDIAVPVAKRCAAQVARRRPSTTGRQPDAAAQGVLPQVHRGVGAGRQSRPPRRHPRARPT